ncbi:hypothetical protein BABINDRAFT_162387 [Babjeviella inositovora NRRL Y-12698]|uniref:Uncharacterized protein n=1 Tax=Babjeviella inositovora NRRL Y-12698 TaxID=984486 RepID=A0A1E3QMJ4_9ASCO|nr:uncharacterized protein BABINDRAFT_162387 [Babjeviella inositovora NRRL Y-12698]ODQ78684.1 hypothetical protein BABINDRAFT_162387 [Babjeviella inositovora NRRL Y-12698]
MSIAVISGGTATNELVSLFSNISSSVSYILPISDNGGSTSELLRVIGGPAIGDIRSRITRLIPEKSEPLRRLLSYRLSDDPWHAKNEWTEIVEGNHPLWAPIEASLKEIFRSFLIHVHVELLKKSRNPLTKFRFELASIGNLFLTGARLFCGSLDAAIELVLRLARVDERVKVLPCLNTNFTYHISALLEDGSIVTGQSQISHPNTSGASPMALIVKTGPLTPVDFLYNDMSHLLNSNTDLPRFLQEVDPEESEDANPPYSHPELRLSQLHFSKMDNIPPLPAAVERIFYISPFGEEIHPQAHTRVVKQLKESHMVVYSIGSLMTSVVPVLVLKGVGQAISHDTNSKKRVLLLNGSLDRETYNMSALDFIETIVESCLYSQNVTFTHKNQKSLSPIGHHYGPRVQENEQDWSRYITHLVHLEYSQIPVDKAVIEQRGVRCIAVRNAVEDGEVQNLYDLEGLQRCLTDLM